MNCFQKRKTQKIGKGMFVTAKMILPTKRDYAKRVSLTGKVLKKISGTYPLFEGIRTKKLILEYIQKLKETGIKTIQTDIKLIKTTQNKFKLIMLQTLIPKENLLINKIKTCSSKEAIELFEKMIITIRKIEEHNKHNSIKIGLDARLKNFGVINNELILIDLYPAYLQGNQSIKLEDISQRKRGLIRKIKRQLLMQNVEKKASNTLKRKMNPQTTINEIINKFISRRPDLKKQFLEKLEYLN
jgi:hypothetical protein